MFEKDKILHFFACAAIVVLAFLLTDDLRIAAVSGVVIGIAKEIYDKFHPESHTFDYMDIAADFAGVITATVAIALLIK